MPGFYLGHRFGAPTQVLDLPGLAILHLAPSLSDQHGSAEVRERGEQLAKIVLRGAGDHVGIDRDPAGAMHQARDAPNQDELDPVIVKCSQDSFSVKRP